MGTTRPPAWCLAQPDGGVGAVLIPPLADFTEVARETWGDSPEQEEGCMVPAEFCPFRAGRAPASCWGVLAPLVQPPQFYLNRDRVP